MCYGVRLCLMTLQCPALDSGHGLLLLLLPATVQVVVETLQGLLDKDLSFMAPVLDCFSNMQLVPQLQVNRQSTTAGSRLMDGGRLPQQHAQPSNAYAAVALPSTSGLWRS